MLKITGKRIKPWVEPRDTKAKKAINTVLKISEELKARGSVPRTEQTVSCEGRMVSTYKL